ncbi:MAG: isoprenyl transferase [Candidatus Cloacimonas sp. 4484_209]|nr:MAG: isoprenyl transferase [Candidatus Cloacimonas sp. 4484_209]
MLNKNNIFARYKINLQKVPKHIAIIMDGNGRWADRKGLPRVMGHYAGIQSVRSTIKAADKVGVKFLTLYTFSTENWKRPKEEVKALMSLLKDLLVSELPEMHKNNIRIKAIGRINELPSGVKNLLKKAIKVTSHNTGIVLVLALNYGGRQEIIDACKKLLKDYKRGKIKRININTFKKFLYDSELPFPDLIIRTSGELRLSNFLIWEAAYSELWITKTLWPDFRRRHLLKAIAEYQKRKRKFGGIIER